jgi:NADH-quinone oxidoreductase subunit I
MDLVYEKGDLLVDHGGKEPAYNFYRHAGIGVAQARGTGEEEHQPVDVRGLMP